MCYFLKLKINITYALDFHSLTNTQETCARVFIAALFTIAKTWKQPKRPSTESGSLCCGIFSHRG